MAIVKLLSECAGSVWRICLKPGDPVAADEPVVILESMKMEIPVAPEKPGIVRHISVAEGEAIAEGTLVAEIET